MLIDKTSPIPQYYQLETWLIEQIEQGVYQPNDKIPTEEEFVRMTGLARETIRHAIKNLVQSGYLIRKRRLGTFVIKRERKADEKPLIGVLVPDIRKGYAPELARGVEDEAILTKHSIILGNTDDLSEKASFHVERFLENGVQGVVFIPTADSDIKNKQIIEKLNEHGIPVVLADRTISNIEIDYVTTNNFEGAYQLNQFLIKNGHRKIATILSSRFSTERQRFEGYKKALKDNNIAIDPSIIITNLGPYVKDDYVNAITDLLVKSERFSAIFAGNDRIAYRINSVAETMGIRIPEDISITGYDDLVFKRSHPMQLTTMQQPIHEMGHVSMKLLLSRINGDSQDVIQRILKSNFVERTSVKNISEREISTSK
jgi:DNA-binding LacI/PurR family transcriptional regulator